MNKHRLLISLIAFLFTIPISAQQSVTWTDTLGISITGDTIRKTATNGWNGGAASVEYLLPATDGWVEATLLEIGTYKAIGLSEVNGDYTVGSIDYAIFFSAIQDRFLVHEKGVEKIALSGSQPGDIFKIVRTGTEINYLKNDSIFYSSTTQSTTKLVVDLAFYSQNSSLSNVHISEAFDINHQQNITQSITWTDIAGISFIADKIVKDSTNGWNAGAASIDYLPPTMDGWVETTIFETGTYKAIGLSEVNGDYTVGSIDYAIFFSAIQNRFLVHEKGIEKLDLNGSQPGDKFKIERIGTQVNYLKNDSIFYSSTMQSTSKLLVDISFNSQNSVLADVNVSPSFLGGPENVQLGNSHWAQNGNSIYYLDTVTIGTDTPVNGHMLSVKGKIAAKGVKVTLDGWADFVFKNDYDLMSLEDLKTFIKKNGHLPDIPKTQEVLMNGIYLGEMNKMLLQKIEELTLHLIQQNEALKKVQLELKELKK